MTRRALREAAVLAAFLVLTFAMTWPWVAHLRDASYDAGDSYLNAWTLAWDFHQTFRDPLHLFDANIFYPYKDTLAFSEHEWGIAVLFFPAFAAGLAPLTVHGLAMLFGFAFSGYGAFRLARTLTGSTLAGWVAGVAFAFVPYRFHHLPHLQYVTAGWLALVAEAVVLFGRERSWRRAAWLGAAFLMSGLSSIHWFLLGLVPTGALAAAAFVRTPAGGRRAWGRGVGAIGVASALLLPFFLPYARVSLKYGFRRGFEEVAGYSARLVHWITPDWNLKLWKGMGENPPQGEFCLFPGFLLLALAAAGALPRARAPERGGARGPSLGRDRVRRVVRDEDAVPHGSLLRSAHVPGDSRARPLGDGRGPRVRPPRGRRGRGPRGEACMAVARRADHSRLLRLRPPPLRGPRRAALSPSRTAGPGPALARPRATPMRGGIFQLPDHFGETNTRYVLRAADHWKPLVNGYSGFETPLAQTLRRLLQDSQTAEMLDALEAVPVSYVTIRRTSVPEGQREQTRALVEAGVSSGRLRFLRRFRPGDDLFAVVRTEPGAIAVETLPPMSYAAPGREDRGSRETWIRRRKTGPSEGRSRSVAGRGFRARISSSRSSSTARKDRSARSRAWPAPTYGERSPPWATAPAPVSARRSRSIPATKARTTSSPCSVPATDASATIRRAGFSGGRDAQRGGRGAA